MRQKRATALFILTVVLGAPSLAQEGRNVDWSLHNLDLYGGRYSPMDQINRSNVATLTPRWLFQHGVIDGVSNQTTPVIVDGTMYVTDSRGSVYALDGANGHLLWTYDVTELLAGGRREGYIFRHRGVTYEKGVIYSAGSFYAYDAATGEELWRFNTGAGVFSSPSVYMGNGEQFVTVASGGGSRGRRGGDLILSFALPPRR